MNIAPPDNFYLFIIVLLICTIAFFKSRKLAVASVDGQLKSLHSLPKHFGMYSALYILFPCLLVMLLWLSVQSSVVTKLVTGSLPESVASMGGQELDLFLNKVRNLVFSAVPNDEAAVASAANDYVRYHNLVSWLLWAVVIGLAIVCYWLSQRLISPRFRARNRVESIIKFFLIVCASIAILTTVGIVASVLFESINFFKLIPIQDFLFGTVWAPGPEAHAKYGAIPLFVGTMLITVIAMLIAVPIGLFSAIYLREYAPSSVRSVAKPLLEILAGIPTVVYGFFAAITVGPSIRDACEWLSKKFNALLPTDIKEKIQEAIQNKGLIESNNAIIARGDEPLLTPEALSQAEETIKINDVSFYYDIVYFFYDIFSSVPSELALSAGFVMGIMIIPFISSLSDDVINAVPQSLRDGSYGLGATKSETIKKVVLPAALPGIVSAVLLALSRAIGETMIVVMAAGLAANLTLNPLESVTTVTVQIVTALVGDQAFDSAQTLVAFALGLVLFIVTLILNIMALIIVRKYREQYD